MQPWQIVVPIKATGRGKSRIELPAAVRQRLAAAMAFDTVTAIARVARVIVVAEGPEDARMLRELPDVRVLLTSVSGLNRAIAHGVMAARSGSVGVLPGDLPGLLSVDLALALASARDHERGVVADRQGVGTTLLTAVTGQRLAAAYGSGSYQRHRDAGHVALDVAPDSTLRRDVDVIGDLRSGPLGTATQRVWDELGLDRPPVACAGAR